MATTIATTTMMMMNSILMREDSRRIWLGCLPPRTTEYAVLQLAKQFGSLDDFQFPVHKAGPLHGSTLGYCFLEYKVAEDARKALKGLNSLNFHGNVLIARPAKPTEEELNLALNAARDSLTFDALEKLELEVGGGERISTQRVDHFDGAAIPNLVVSPTDTTIRASSSFVSGSAGEPSSYLQCKSAKPSAKTPVCTTQSKLDTKSAIQRIEMELHKMEQNPIGGADFLKPSASVQNPVYVPCLLKNQLKSVSKNLDNRRHSAGGRRHLRNSKQTERFRTKRRF